VPGLVAVTRKGIGLRSTASQNDQYGHIDGGVMVAETSAVNFRQNLGEMLNQVQYRRDSVLITKDGKPVVAAVSVLLLDDAGNQNQAAAYSVCIMVVVALVLILFHWLLRLTGNKSVSVIR